MTIDQLLRDSAPAEADLIEHTQRIRDQVLAGLDGPARRPRRRRWKFISAGVAGVVVIGGGAAAAAGGFDELLTIARDRGISVEEAQARVAWQNDFAIAATAVEEQFPDSFAEAEITSELPAIGTIRFKGAVPAGVEQLLADLPASIEVRLEGGSGLSAAEVDELIIEAHYAVGDSGRVADIVSSYDKSTGKVNVVARPLSPLGKDALKREAQEIVAGLPAHLRGRVSLVLSNSVRSSDDAQN